MRKVIFLVGLILATSATFVCGEQMGNPQNLNVRSNEVRADKIKAFVDGFETYAKQILDDYKKEVEGIEAKYKAEKHNKMLSKIGEYFGGKDFSLQEWLLIQQEFDKIYKVGEADYDQLGSEVAYSMVRQYSEKTESPNLNNLLAIIADKNYDSELRTKYVNYLAELVHEIYYYPNEKHKVSIDDKTKNKVVDMLTVNINDKTNGLTLRKESAYILAGYFGENEKAVDTILNILNDPTENEEMKSRIIFGAGIKFGAGRNPKINEKLSEIIKDRNNYSHNVVSMTIETLCYLGDKRAINTAIDILNTTQDKNLFKEIAASLSKTDDKEAIKAVLKNNSKFDMDTVYFVILKDPILIDIMNSEPKEYALLAIKALGANLTKEPLKVAKELESKIYDSQPEIRSAAIHALAKIGKKGDVGLKNEILTVFNKAKKDEKNDEVMREIDSNIKMLEGKP